jgi:hypothetical protein
MPGLYKIPLSNLFPMSKIAKNGFNKKKNKHKVVRTKLCFVKDCKRNSKDNPELQFFCVPMAVQRREKWFAIANAKYVSYRNYYCEDHSKSLIFTKLQKVVQYLENYRLMRCCTKH